MLYIHLLDMVGLLFHSLGKIFHLRRLQNHIGMLGLLAVSVPPAFWTCLVHNRHKIVQQPH